MKNEWDSVWVNRTVKKEVLERDLISLNDLRDVVGEVDNLILEEGWAIHSHVEAFPDETPYIRVWQERELSPEEIDTAKKAQWLKTKDYQEKKDLEDFLRLKKKFETNDKELL